MHRIVYTYTRATVAPATGAQAGLSHRIDVQYVRKQESRWKVAGKSLNLITSASLMFLGKNVLNMLHLVLTKYKTSVTKFVCKPYKLLTMKQNVFFYVNLTVVLSFVSLYQKIWAVKYLESLC